MLVFNATACGGRHRQRRGRIGFTVRFEAVQTAFFALTIETARDWGGCPSQGGWADAL